MSKKLFELMREREIQTSNFLPTKAEIQFSAKKFAKDLIEKGEVDKVELFAQAVRLNEVLSIVTDELKNTLPSENFEAFGVKGTFRNGGSTPNYKECEIWSDIAKELKEREELLKLAMKSDKEIYDEAGVLVPKVSEIIRKSSLSITF
jgi:hypothetical protein